MESSETAVHKQRLKNQNHYKFGQLFGVTALHVHFEAIESGLMLSSKIWFEATYFNSKFTAPSDYYGTLTLECTTVLTEVKIFLGLNDLVIAQ